MQLVRYVLLGEVDVRSQLFVHARHQRSSRFAKPTGIDLEHDRDEETAFPELHPFEMPDVLFAIRSRQPVLVPVTFAQILDDCAAFGNHQPVILDNRRLAQRMNLLEFGRSEVGFGIALVGDKLVVGPQLFEQPEYAL